MEMNKKTMKIRNIENVIDPELEEFRENFMKLNLEGIE